MPVISGRCTFNEWGELKKRFGLLVRESMIDTSGRMVMVLEARNRDGEPVTIAGKVKTKAPAAAVQEAAPAAVKAKEKPMAVMEKLPEPQVTTTPRNKLAALLADLHQQAAAHPGEEQRVQLPGGLQIRLIIGIDGRTRILLARQTVHPSSVEWKTTLAHLPYPPGEIDPEPFIYNGWGCLRSAWETRGAGNG